MIKTRKRTVQKRAIQTARESHMDSVSIDELPNIRCHLQVIGINSFSTPHNYTVVRTRDVKKKNKTNAVNARNEDEDIELIGDGNRASDILGLGQGGRKNIS